MLWKLNRDDCRWQAVFRALFMDQEVPATPMKAKKKGKDGTPKTPNSSKKRSKKVQTPEKPREVPKRVDDCRPIAFGQPAQSDTMLKKPCKKRRKVGQMQTAHEGEGEEENILKRKDDEQWDGFDAVDMENDAEEDCHCSNDSHVCLDQDQWFLINLFFPSRLSDVYVCTAFCSQTFDGCLHPATSGLSCVQAQKASALMQIQEAFQASD